jgi:hypothetical protein
MRPSIGKKLPPLNKIMRPSIGKNYHPWTKSWGLQLEKINVPEQNYEAFNCKKLPPLNKIMRLSFGKNYHPWIRYCRNYNVGECTVNRTYSVYHNNYNGAI